MPRVLIVDSVARVDRRKVLKSLLEQAQCTVSEPVSSLKNLSSLGSDLLFCHANDLLVNIQWQGATLSSWLDAECAIVLYSGHGVVCREESDSNQLFIQTDGVNQEGSAAQHSIANANWKEFTTLIPYPVSVGDEMPIADAISAFVEAKNLGPLEATRRLRDVLTGFDAVLELKLALLDAYCAGEAPNTEWDNARSETKKQLIGDCVDRRHRFASACPGNVPCSAVKLGMENADTYPFGGVSAMDLRRLFFGDI